MASIKNTCHTKTASTRLIETETGEHDFTITNSSFGGVVTEGKGFSSGNFIVGGYNWTVWLKLIDWGNSGGYLSAYLDLQGSTSVNAQSIVCVLGQNGKPSKHSFKTGPCVIHSSKTCGVMGFVTRGELEQSKCLVNDSLTVRCTLTVGKTSYLQNTKPCRNTSLPPTELPMHLGNLLDSGESTDVTFDVDGEIFHAHKLVLAARSPIFKAELYGSMMEAMSGCVVIKDIKASIFRSMLNFIYRDSLAEADLQGGNDAKQDSVFFAQHLMVAADRYGLHRLKLICANKLYDCINVDNVAANLVLAEQHNCFQLKKACLEFLAHPEVFQAVVVSDEFLHLWKSCPTILKELPIQKKMKISDDAFFSPVTDI
jgi:speckle-type POZ protein